MDDDIRRSHPSCHCENEQNVMAPANDLIVMMQYVGRKHNICALNMLVCAHILVRYMRDVVSDDPAHEQMNVEASRLADDIYTFSQSYVEKNYGGITTLSNRRGKPC